MKRYLIALALALTLCSVAAGQTEAMTFQQFRDQRAYIRSRAHEIKVSKCRSHARLHFVRWAVDVPKRRWDENLALWKRRREYAKARASACYSDPIDAIRHVFGSYGDQAVSVARCETGGTFSLSATNGQYVGLFQMGYSERKKYGWYEAGAAALTQSRSAYNYFVDSGRDWSPWQCQPDGSLAW